VDSIYGVKFENEGLES